MVAGIDGLFHEAAPVLASPHNVLVVELRRRTPHIGTPLFGNVQPGSAKKKKEKYQIPKETAPPVIVAVAVAPFLSSREREREREREPIILALWAVDVPSLKKHLSFFSSNPYIYTHVFWQQNRLINNHLPQF